MFKKYLIICFFIPFIGYSQYSSKYKELNVGIYYDPNFITWPGASFLFGKTVYFSDNLFSDIQLGLAFPSIGTAKVGLGLGDSMNSVQFGLRPFPTSFYLQYTWREKRLLAFEIMPTNTYTNPDKYLKFIFNYGYRW